MSLRSWLLPALLTLGAARGALAQDPSGVAALDSASPPPVASGPWRLADQLPPWLHVEGSHRARFEYVANQFRAGRAGDNHAVSLRTLLLAELRFGALRVGAELEDSRAYALDDEAPVDTSLVNPVELLQAYVRLETDYFLAPHAKGWIRAGRFTADFGERRLVARNRFRNTLNAFTGVEGHWTSSTGFELHALAGLPIQRRPLAASDLEDNELEFDREHEDVHFYGGELSSPELFELGLRGALYAFALNERDTSNRATADRELYTPGVRLWREPAEGEFDLELEAAFQFGHSRASTASSDRRTLDHLAYFGHLTLGYTFAAPGQPRLALLYDYVSGDANPSDGRNHRFDTLFGARRFEFGPTGIYGVLARGNLNSPGLKLELRPLRDLRLFTAYRAAWLAAKRDAWTAARVRDPAGDSDRFLGHFLEAAVRWDLLPKNLRLESGFAVLLRGHFARTAPNANPGGEHLMGYAQLVLSF